MLGLNLSANWYKLAHILDSATASESFLLLVFLKGCKKQAEGNRARRKGSVGEAIAQLSFFHKEAGSTLVEVDKSSNIQYFIHNLKSSLS